MHLIFETDVETDVFKIITDKSQFFVVCIMEISEIT